MLGDTRRAPSLSRSLRDIARPCRGFLVHRQIMFVGATVLAILYTGRLEVAWFGIVFVVVDWVDWVNSKRVLACPVLTDRQARRFERVHVISGMISASAMSACALTVAVLEPAVLHFLPAMFLFCAALYNGMFNSSLYRVLAVRTTIYSVTFVALAAIEVSAPLAGVSLEAWMQLATVAFVASFLAWNSVEARSSYVERALQAEELELRQQHQTDLLRVTSDWFWETDRFNSLVWSTDEHLSNKSAGRLEPDFSLERLFFDGTATGQDLRAALSKGVAFHDVAQRLPTRDGSIRTFIFSGVPKYGPDGEFDGFRGAAHDVSDLMLAEVRRQRLEDLLERGHRMRVIGQLSSGIAHDFNDLLTIMLANLDLALETELTSEGRRLVGEAHHAASRGTTMTASLNALGGQARMHPEPTDVLQVVDAASAMLRRTFPMNIEIDVDVDPAVAECGAIAVEVDPRMLEGALVHLAINGRDAMPEGGRLVFSVSRGEPQQPAGRSPVHIVVQDSGSGGLSYRLEGGNDARHTSDDPVGARNLGLTAVAGFVAQANGEMDIDTMSGQGTRVRLSFPELVGQAPNTRERPRRPVQRPFLGKRALVVDDEPNVARAVALQLRSLGFEARMASHGEAALKLVRNSDPFDLLISDVDMPGDLNGTGLADLLSAEKPALPVVLMSGHFDADGLPEDPMRAFLAKPFSRADLVDAAERVMGHADRHSRANEKIVSLFGSRT